MLEANSAPDYQEKLEAELKEMREFGNVAGRRGGPLAAAGELEEIVTLYVNCDDCINSGIDNRRDL